MNHSPQIVGYFFDFSARYLVSCCLILGCNLVKKMESLLNGFSAFMYAKSVINDNDFKIEKTSCLNGFNSGLTLSQNRSLARHLQISGLLRGLAQKT